jgi:flavorubredoxin
MISKLKITDNIWWTGFNDRRTQLFENLWPLPHGVAYNSYVIVDEKCALIDTAHALAGADFLESLASILDGRRLDYLVVNHMEPDHSGEIGDVARLYPGVKIVGNKRTFSILEAYFGPSDNLVEVVDGDTLALGRHTLQFFLTPWVHWPETMMSFELTEGVLFSGDAFGSFGAIDGGVFDDQAVFDSLREEEMRRYYSNVVGKYSSFVQKALARLAGLPVKVVCPVHGLVWRGDPARVMGLYDRWSHYEADNAVVIVYGTLYGYTARMADHIARLLAAEGVRDVRVYDASKTHLSYIISEIWRCRGVIIGSCAYNAQMFPAIEALTSKIALIGVKQRLWGLFGTFSWNGGGVRNLAAFAQGASLKLASEPVEIQGAPTEEKLAPCAVLARAMAEALKKA